MKARDILRITAAFGFLSCASLPVSASHGEGMGEKWEHKHEERVKKVHEKLGLSPDQAKKLEENRKKHREEAKSLRAQMKEKRQALRAELEKPALDMSKVNAIHAELKDFHNKLADHRLKSVLEVREILTPEQFKKFHELMKGHRGHGKRDHSGERD